MVKNPSPQQMAKGGHSNKKQTPHSVKPDKATPMSIKSSGKSFQSAKESLSTPKQKFQTAKTGQTPVVQKSGQKFATPKQVLKFQTPKKGQVSGKKVLTPHPMKKKEIESDEDDENESEDDDVPKNGSGSQKKKQVAKPATPMTKQGKPLKSKMQPMDEDLDDSGEFSELDDEEDWSSIDEDEDEEETPPSKQKLIALLKGKQQGKRPAPEDDEDEEDEDEEDDDEDDEDEDDEEESSDDEETAAKGQLTKATFPKKGVQQMKAEPASKKMKTNEGKAASVLKKDEAEKLSKRPAMLTTLDKKLQDEVNERKRERNSRSVFFKNLHRSVTDDDIKALSSDILFVQRKSPGLPWGWIMFANEPTCKRNYQKLNGAKVGNSKLELDLCENKEAAEAHRVDAMKLYIGNLPRQTKDSELKRLFPKSSSIYHRADKSFAIIGFESPELARQAFQSNKDVEINGSKATVCFAKALEKGRKPDPVKKFAKEKASGKIAIKG
jgi:hypothetical protein